ncbi:MAG: hypothetical protein LBR32_04055 [Propionibacteriaceae bacterium]|jgi:hypothetical protein|nr:hypothetical protein [Propionibacteriaceae bacterium]
MNNPEETRRPSSTRTVFVLGAVAVVALAAASLVHFWPGGFDATSSASQTPSPDPTANPTPTAAVRVMLDEVYLEGDQLHYPGGVVALGDDAEEFGLLPLACGSEQQPCEVGLLPVGGRDPKPDLAVAEATWQTKTLANGQLAWLATAPLGSPPATAIVKSIDYTDRDGQPAVIEP